MRPMNRPKTSSQPKSGKTDRNVTYRFAARRDKDDVRQLLSECGLPTRYVHRYVRNFMVAEAGKKKVGVIGVEPYGRVGLLRSLCVDPEFRDRGIAMALNEKMLDYARAQKIDRLYLFTMRAEKFAARLGFRKLERSRIPPSIRATWQYRGSRGYPVVCMVKEIDRDSRSSASGASRPGKK